MQQVNTKTQSSATPFMYETEENGVGDDLVKVRLWTRDEYYQMAELGFFRGKRVELIEGEIIEMSPMKSLHMTGISLADEVLREVFTSGFIIRVQAPLSFSGITEPEPDVAVVKGKIRDFTDEHPKTAELIVEVSDATLRYDRTKKAELYAKNKIQEYWILNVKSRSLEVYRRPIRDKKLGFVYTEIQILTEKDSMSPLAKPNAKIKIADILP
jgi:Uma2 family endonuclease